MQHPLHKQDALAEIVSIAAKNGLTAQDIAQAFNAAQGSATQAEDGGSKLKRIFSYIGGILILSGICAFVATIWPDIGSFARVVITLGTGIVAFIMALSASHDPRYERMATPLFLIAALFQPAGIFVMLDEYSRGGDPHMGVLFMATYMVIQQGLTFYKKQLTVLAFTTTFFVGTFFANLMDWVDVPEKWTALTLSLATIAAARAMDKSRHMTIAPFWYFVSSACLLFSVFEIVEGGMLEILYLGTTGLLMYASIAFRSRTLLLNSTLGMLWYIGYFTAEHFANSVGWPILLIILGLIFMGIGSLAVKINNKYIKQKG
jgi:uncharacterized membrane protein